MAIGAVLACIAFGAALLFLLLFCYRGPSWPKTIVKTIPLIALAIAAGLEGLSSWLVIGLALSALGDYALSRPGERLFLIGLIAFAMAHLSYVILFLFDLPSGNAMPPLWIWVLVVGLWGAAWIIFVRQTGDLKGPVIVYIGLISAMILSAGSVTNPHAMVLLGALIFAASDFVLTTQMFRSMSRGWDVAASFFVWGSYILAQFTIALSVAQMAF